MNDDAQVIEKYTKMDKLAAECINSSEQVPPPVIVTFGPGWLTRECHLKKGDIAVTKIHNTNHPYFLPKGKVSVSEDGENFTVLEAPYFGITTPGTQRFMIVHEDAIWITFHPNADNETDLEKIEKRDMKPYEVPKELLSGANKQIK